MPCFETAACIQYQKTQGLAESGGLKKILSTTEKVFLFCAAPCFAKKTQQNEVVNEF